MDYTVTVQVKGRFRDEDLFSMRFDVPEEALLGLKTPSLNAYLSGVVGLLMPHVIPERMDVPPASDQFADPRVYRDSGLAISGITTADPCTVFSPDFQ